MLRRERTLESFLREFDRSNYQLGTGIDIYKEND